MVTRTSAKADVPEPKKKTKSKGGLGAKKKLSPFNKFMQVELRRLKETKPDILHKDRFKAAVESWNKSKPKTT